MIPQPIIDYYNALSPIPAEEWARVAPLFQPKSFKKNEFFLRIDEKPQHIGVVLSGIFRLYYIDDDGKEWVKSFEYSKGLLAAYAEIIQKKPSRTFIQAIADSELLIAPEAEFMEATQGRLCWEAFLRKVAERYYIRKENREYEFLKFQAKERWDRFKLEFADIHQLIPDYHIASYLGITPQSLSRLRRTKAN
jgi:CRP-like cAMP-binding protein